MASIRKRGSRQWEARVRRKNHSVQSGIFDTRAEAEAWARGIENQMDRGVFRSHAKAERTSIHEALEGYIADTSLAWLRLLVR